MVGSSATPGLSFSLPLRETSLRNLGRNPRMALSIAGDGGMELYESPSFRVQT